MSGYPERKLADGTSCWSGPNCRKHGNIASASPLGDFNKRLDALNTGKVVNPLANLAPSDIDNQLSEIYERYNRKRNDETAVLKTIEAHEKSLKRLELRQQEVYSPTSQRTVDQIKGLIETNKAEAEKLNGEAKLIQQEMIPGETEFMRRGGWTRAFLVDNAGGHVHRSMGCSTCYPTTRYVWLPEYSGKPEEEIVDAAGHQACTECYKSAPVDVWQKASRIVNPIKAAEKAKIDAAKAVKRAAADAKAITNIDGSPLAIKSYYGTIKTTTAATNFAVEKQSDVFAAERIEDSFPNKAYLQKIKNDLAVVTEALAAKNDITVEEQKKILMDKAEKKFKRDWKERL